MTDKTSFADAIDPKADAGQESPAPTPEQQADQQVALVVGERAFTTMDDVKKKIVHADEHIGTLEGENQRLKEQLEDAMSRLEESTSIKDVLNKMEGGKDESLSLEKIKELVSTEITSTKQVEQQQNNVSQCLSAAEQAYGEGFGEKVAAIAKDLGIATAEIDRMAAESPKLFAKTFLPNGSITAPASSHSGSVRTSIYDEKPAQFEVKAPLSMNAKERTQHFIQAVEAKLKQLN